MSSRLATNLFVVPLALVPLAVSCSDDDDGAGGIPLQSGADVLIRDAAVHDLLAFTAEVQSVRLRTQAGGFTNNLVGTGPVEVEFLGLGDALAFLSHGDIPQDSYDAVEIGFTPGSYSARAEDGSVVTVASSSDTLLAPFPALLVFGTARGSGPGFQGVVTDVTGLRDAFIVRLEPHDPAITGGLVQDDLTDVIVDLSASTVVLDVEGDPVLFPDDVGLELELETEGAFTGPATAPTLSATRVRVRPGFLDDALVTNSDEGAGSFTTSGGELVDPFGPNVAPGAQLVVLEPTAAITGDIVTRAELFDLLQGPEGSSAEIDVLGLGTGTANEIRAFRVDVEVAPPGTPFPTFPATKARRTDAAELPETTVAPGG